MGAQSPKDGENAWTSGDKAPSGNVRGEEKVTNTKEGTG